MHVLLMHTVSEWCKLCGQMICGVGRLHHTNLLFYRCRVLKFQDLIYLKMCSIMYKIYNNMPVPVNVQRFITSHANLRPFRVQCQYVRHCIRTNIKSRCLSIYGVKHWNSLSARTTSVPTFYAFVNKLKMDMFNRYL